MLKNGRVRLVLDYPSSRSLHASPIPRTGGVAIIASILGWSPLYAESTVILVCAGLLALVSFVDDWRGLRIFWRFAVHLVSALAFAWSCLTDQTLLSTLLIVLAIVWSTNLYNFMDGSDGLAGGMTVVGFSSYAVVSCFHHHLPLCLLSLNVAVSALAFLCFNFHPARIFLGDVGSIPLGFLAAAIGLLGWQAGLWPIWFPLLVFSPFVVDATATLLKRLLGGELIWKPHRTHYYQRLVQLGWGHKRTAFAEYALMLATSGSALWAVRRSELEQAAVLASWSGAFAVMAFVIDRAWRARAHAHEAASRGQ